MEDREVVEVCYLDFNSVGHHLSDCKLVPDGVSALARQWVERNTNNHSLTTQMSN